MIGELTMNCRLLPVVDCQKLLAATAEQPRASDEEALTLARMLMGNYRKTDFQDPDIFSVSLASNFAAFPMSIGRQVVDPVKGLPSKIKFPPSIAEVHEALTSALVYRRAIAYRAGWMLDQHRNRGPLDVKSPSTPEARAEVIAKIDSEISAIGKTNSMKEAIKLKEPTPDEIEALKQKLGVTNLPEDLR